MPYGHASVLALEGVLMLLSIALVLERGEQQSVCSTLYAHASALVLYRGTRHIDAQYFALVRRLARYNL